MYDFHQFKESHLGPHMQSTGSLCNLSTNAQWWHAIKWGRTSISSIQNEVFFLLNGILRHKSAGCINWQWVDLSWFTSSQELGSNLLTAFPLFTTPALGLWCVHWRCSTVKKIGFLSKCPQEFYRSVHCIALQLLHLLGSNLVGLVWAVTERAMVGQYWVSCSYLCRRNWFRQEQESK